ncbi:mechanosensitive ion channel family protein [Candidatus Altiarchaeota archaeon]
MVGEFVSKTFFGNTIFEYFIALGIVLASILVGKIAYYIINRHAKKIVKKTKTNLDDLLIDAIEEPLIIFLFAVGLLISVKSINIPSSLQLVSSGVITAIFVVDIVWLKTRIVDILMKEYFKPLTRKTQTHLDEQLLPILQKGLTAITIIIGALIIISNFGVDISALLAGLGIGGLALALASKDTVENLFGAFAILTDRPFRIHDRIVVDGITGEVLEVGLRSTRIRTINNTEFIIPNGKVAASNIENISRPDRRLARNFTLSLTYDISIEKLREGIDIVKDILAETEGVSEKYKPTVVFKEFAASSNDIFVKLWVEDYKQRHRVMDKVNQAIKERFKKAGIEFAYPTQTLHIRK